MVWLTILLSWLYTLNQMANGETRGILQNVGAELKQNPPAIVKQTAQKFGATRALAQKRAILLSKARRQGARIPQAPGMTSR